MNQQIIPKVINRVNEIYEIVFEDIALEIEGILGDNISETDKLNHIYQLAQELKKGGKDGKDNKVQV